MEIVTEFNIGDIVYILEDANKGNLVPVIIEKIILSVERENLIITSYQVSSTNKFHNTVFYENQLTTFENAKVIVNTKINEEIKELERKKI
jgi:hypothetical protein